MQPETNSALDDSGDAATALADTEAPQNDQMLVLVVGFAIGMTIGGMFLIYIVLASARLLT